LRRYGVSAGHPAITVHVGIAGKPTGRLRIS
jgi:hypothetical protein